MDAPSAAMQHQLSSCSREAVDEAEHWIIRIRAFSRPMALLLAQLP